MNVATPELTTTRRRSTIPLIVDDLKPLPDYPLVRCNYLSVECDAEASPWTIHIGGRRLPFFMAGLSGVITRAPGASKFRDVTDLENLFELIEDEAGLLIDIDDIWLPDFLFRRTRFRPRNGRVYRITPEAFSLALTFREGRLDLPRFIEAVRELPKPLAYSGRETGTFEAWRNRQIQDARDRFPKKESLKLEYS